LERDKNYDTRRIIILRRGWINIAIYERYERYERWLFWKLEIIKNRVIRCKLGEIIIMRLVKNIINKDNQERFFYLKKVKEVQVSRLKTSFPKSKKFSFYINKILLKCSLQ